MNKSRVIGTAVIILLLAGAAFWLARNQKTTLTPPVGQNGGVEEAVSPSLYVATGSLQGLDLRKPLSVSYQLFKSPKTYVNEYIGFAFDYDEGFLFPMEPTLLSKDLTVTDDSTVNAPSFIVSKEGVAYTDGYIGRIKFFPSLPIKRVSWGDSVTSTYAADLYIFNFQKQQVGSKCYRKEVLINTSESEESNGVRLISERPPTLTGSTWHWRGSICAGNLEYRFFVSSEDGGQQTDSRVRVDKLIQSVRTFRSLER